MMETELDDRGLQDGIADKPVAGYLYFPVGETKSSSARNLSISMTPER